MEELIHLSVLVLHIESVITETLPFDLGTVVDIIWINKTKDQTGSGNFKCGGEAKMLPESRISVKFCGGKIIQGSKTGQNSKQNIETQMYPYPGSEAAARAKRSKPRSWTLGKQQGYSEHKLSEERSEDFGPAN